MQKRTALAPRKKSPGRPKGAAPPIKSTGVRIPPELLARVDAVVPLINRELAGRGASVTRSSVIVSAIERFCDLEEARAAGSAS